MAEIRKVEGSDGQLLGFVLDGRLFEKQGRWDESKALRSLANALFNELLMIEPDTSEASKALRDEYERDLKA